MMEQNNLEQVLKLDEYEREAISRIKRFASLAHKMGFEICLGFSGGKDSQVCYHLCKRAGIQFKAYFNHCFESNTTKQFIHQYYPDVIYRRAVTDGFITNIYKNHGGALPTVHMSYCCADYKHNPKNVDDCSIIGIRREESIVRRNKTTISVKNKRTLNKNKKIVDEYFAEQCQSTGTAGIIQLRPIIDWSDEHVWLYIQKNNIPINPEYKYAHRVGCIVCPKANFSANYKGLLRYPKLIDAFIMAKTRGGKKGDWVINCDNKDYSDDKPYYICRWLNHSFMPFTKRQEEYYQQVRKAYDQLHNKQ